MMTMSMKIIYKVCTERKFGHKKRATEAALFENKISLGLFEFAKSNNLFDIN